jgi:hypothetical protein
MGLMLLRNYYDSPIQRARDAFGGRIRDCRLNILTMTCCSGITAG